ncbi:hypothetical protein [Thermus amyloliquefaciens]|uniref:hypothetical protein n=1 Tax=Thermus amyloliquefaciens TaxID=1449080 RepID=UPI000A8A557E|nr:hypothetical protein [Thermus amyloliquefaciens]
MAHLLLAPVSVMPPENPPPTWPLMLLATQELPGERMQRVEDRPLTWVAWRKEAWRATYVLKPDQRGRWTWFLTKEFHRALLEEALAYAAEGDWRALVGHMKALGNLPMFSGVWSQVQEIRRRVQKLWGTGTCGIPRANGRPRPGGRPWRRGPRPPLPHRDAPLPRGASPDPRGVVGGPPEGGRRVIRRLAGVLWALAQTLPDPERDPDLGPFCTYLRQKYGRHALDLSPGAWEEGLLDLIAETIAEGWDRYGAPRPPGSRGGGVHRQRRGGPETILARGQTKREAYREARRAWVRRLLG